MDPAKDNRQIFETAEYKRSRKAYIAQSALRYWIYLLTVDTFLSKLLLSVGISDSLIGVISAFTSLAWLFQLLSLLIARSRFSSKTISIFYDTISVVLFGLMYTIPLSPFSQSAKIALMVTGAFFACVTQTMVVPIYTKWANSFVNIKTLATFTATREMVSGLTSAVFVAVMGYVVDKYEGLGNLNGGFLFVSCIIFILGVFNLISYLLIGKEKVKEKDDKDDLKSAISYIIQNKTFQRVIIVNLFWEAARSVSVGFMGTYKLRELEMTVLTSQIINIAAMFLRNIVARPLGKYTDRHSFVGGLSLGFSIAAVSFACVMFTTRETRFLIVIYTILYQCAMAAVESNVINVVYDYVSFDYLVHAMAIKNSIVGVFGMLVSVVAGAVLDFIQKNGNQLLGIHLYGQQFLAGLSLCLTLIAIGYARHIPKKEKTENM